MNRAELKAAAKNQIKGKVGLLFIITLIISLISGFAGLVAGLLPFGSVVVAVVITPAFALSLIRIYLNVCAGNTPDIKDAFCGFDDFWAAFKVTFLVGLFTFLWSLLFIIPGIVKGYSYSMSMYILAENNGKKALECINESKLMTEGKKMDLFVLNLSFIGWGLLCAITLGIASIWVVPYMQTTLTNVYNSIKPVKEDVPEPEPEAPYVKPE